MSDEVGKTNYQRLYRCLQCPTQEKAYVGHRYRTIGHVLKMHMRLTEVPHYCSLCLYRCVEKEELLRHRSIFGPHNVQKDRAEKKGTWQGEEFYEEKNEHPRKIVEDSHYYKLSREESRRIAEEQREERQRKEKERKERQEKERKEKERLEEVTVTVTEEIVEVPPSTPKALSPPDSPLSSPMRRVLQKEQEDQANEEAQLLLEREERAHEEELLAAGLPIVLSTPAVTEQASPVPTHPAAEWNMVPVDNEHDKRKSSAASISSHQTVPMEQLSAKFEAVTEVVKDCFGQLMTRIGNLETEVSTLTSKVTGLRQVVREQNQTIADLSKPPSFRVQSTAVVPKKRSRSRTPQPQNQRKHQDRRQNRRR